MNERILAGWMVLGLCGCAVDVREGVDVGDDSEALAQVEQELASPTSRNKRGVVEFQLEGRDKCTGVMINSHYMLTAFRCVADEYDAHFGAEAKVSYFDPALAIGEKREVTNGYDPVEVSMQLGYALWSVALIRRPGGWLGTTLTDYQRISLGSCADIDVSTFYGRGSGGPAGGAGLLRFMPVNVDDCYTSWFRDLGPYAACPGDFGGPYIGRAGDWDVITGIMTFMQGGTEACANGGRDQVGTVIDPSTLDWIEDEMNYTCHQFSANQHEYARCWDT